MKVACLFSGGKDSVFAAFCCMFSGWDTSLLTIEPAEYSAMFHHPNVRWCREQAGAMGLPIKFVKAKGKSGEDELSAMKSALSAMRAGGVCSGAIESEYQKQRIDQIAHELGIRSFARIWRTGDALLREQCEYFETYVAAVSAEGLGKGDLAARFDAAFVSRLRSLRVPVSPHLEGGEGETFVANAPFFRKRLGVTGWKKSHDGVRGVAEITGIR